VVEKVQVTGAPAATSDCSDEEPPPTGTVVAGPNPPVPPLPQIKYAPAPIIIIMTTPAITFVFIVVKVYNNAQHGQDG